MHVSQNKRQIETLHFTRLKNCIPHLNSRSSNNAHSWVQFINRPSLVMSYVHGFTYTDDKLPEIGVSVHFGIQCHKELMGYPIQWTTSRDNERKSKYCKLIRTPSHPHQRRTDCIEITDNSHLCIDAVP